MRSVKKIQKIEDFRKDCGKCYDYSNPNSYWQSFYAQRETSY